MADHESGRGRTQAGTRARDVDRVTSMQILDDALLDGQLSIGEHRQRVEDAKSASTLAQLDSIVSDLQRGTESPADSASTRSVDPRVILGIVAILAVVALQVGVVVVTRASSDDEAGAPVPSDPLVEGAMFTAGGIRGIIEATRQRFGTTVVQGVHLYRDDAVLHVLDPKSPTGAVHYDFSPGGEFHNPQVYSGLSVNSTGSPDVVVYLADVDADSVADLIASAPARLGISAATVGQAKFRVTIGGDDGGEIWMGVNDISLDSHLVAGLDGHIKGVHRCGWGC
ncbi:DUF1707 SHOCT-like domain-containing protein [Gordonia sp. NPDC003422]